MQNIIFRIIIAFQEFQMYMNLNIKEFHSQKIFDVFYALKIKNKK